MGGSYKGETAESGSMGRGVRGMLHRSCGNVCSGFWATVCKTVCPMLSDRCLSVLTVCDVGVLWPNGWIDQDATWYGGRPRHRPHCVRRGPSSPPQKKRVAQPRIFGSCLLWPNGWMDQEATLYEVGLSPGDIVLDGTQVPQKGHSSPHFSADVYCGKTVTHLSNC